jgi:hypothetical protein
MMNIALAEALLRRKELQEKIEQLRRVKDEDLKAHIISRRKVSDDWDDLEASVPKLSIKEVTKAFDFYAKRLRLIDACIQKANWDTVITVPDLVLEDPLD